MVRKQSDSSKELSASREQRCLPSSAGSAEGAASALSLQAASSRRRSSTEEEFRKCIAVKIPLLCNRIHCKSSRHSFHPQPPQHKNIPVKHVLLRAMGTQKCHISPRGHRCLSHRSPQPRDCPLVSAGGEALCGPSPADSCRRRGCRKLCAASATSLQRSHGALCTAASYLQSCSVHRALGRCPAPSACGFVSGQREVR